MTTSLDLLTLALSGRRRRGLDPTRAVVYLRASTDRQALSPEAQRASIKAWSQRLRCVLVGEFEEKDVSGGADLDDRPGLLAAIDAVVAQRAGILVVASRSRLGRDRVLVGLVERAIQRLGARLVAVDQPEGLLQAAVSDVFNEHERLEIGKRTCLALAAKKAKGERVGGVPWGFRLAKDGVRLIPDQIEREIIITAQRLHRRGRSLRQIGERLGRRGFTTRAGRATWWPAQIQALLRACSLLQAGRRN